MDNLSIDVETLIEIIGNELEVLDVEIVEENHG